MTAQLHGTGYVMSWTPHASLNGGRPARADILVSQAGRARHLYEMLSGQSTANMPPVAPIPPHSLAKPGHDHSGGIFGVPVVRTLYSAAFGHDDFILGSDVDAGRAPRMCLASGDGVDFPYYIYSGSFKCLWIPDCAQDGCYVDALLTFNFYASAAATVHMDFKVGGHTFAAVTHSIAGTGHNYWAVTDRIPLDHGRLSSAHLHLWLAGTGSSGPTVSLLGMGIHQTRTAP